MQGKSYEAVVFDMDGVIFDSEYYVIECWKEIAEKYNIENIEYACRQCLGLNRDITRNKFKEIYGQDFPYDTYKAEMSALFHERYSGGKLPMKKGVVELLSFLKENGKKIALASSTRKEIVHRELSDAGLINYFDKIVCGDMISRSKPFPDIFLTACEQLGVNPGNAYAIEDSYNGIRSANSANMRTIMVPDLAIPTEEMEALTECILESLLDVKEYLE